MKELSIAQLEVRLEMTSIEVNCNWSIAF